ncbi:MAG TPA: hypothetical protein GX517_04485 [Alicyclobacillus sp.]|nr:hypothetical protein [Alicyclobacillus sp.]
MIEVGDFVRWTSQSGGFWKEKRGRVIALVPSGDRIDHVWPGARKVLKSRRKWSEMFSSNERAVVEVPRERGGGFDYYAPRLSALEKCSEEGMEI